MNARRLKGLARDPLFGVAVLAGPVCWFALVALDVLRFAGLVPVLSPGGVLLLVLVYPVVEEIVFRGGIQWKMRQWLHGVLWPGISHANVITSGLFVLFHLLGHTPWWAIGVFVPSLIFGFFLDRYRSVVPGILLHGWYNAGLVLVFQIA